MTTPSTPASPVECRIAALRLDPENNTPVVILKELAGERVVPIWIGLLEAHAIALELEHIRPARPMTHDLMRELIDALGGAIGRVEITELTGNTFYASIHLTDAGGVRRIDSRPSDALALALRAGAAIFVHESVLQQVAPATTATATESLDSILESLPNEAFGPYKN